MKKCRPIAVDGVVISDNKILVVKRREEPFKGMWALPGGMVEMGETAEGAVVREVKEETGIDIQPAILLGVYSSPNRDPRQTVSIAYLCIVSGNNKPKPGTDAEEAKWLSLKEIVNETLAFDHNKIISDGIKLLKTITSQVRK